MWLEANQTSRDPRVIAGYYMKAVRKLHGAPCRVRADLGTENTYVSQMQTFLRSYNTDQFENISLSLEQAPTTEELDSGGVF